MGELQGSNSIDNSDISHLVGECPEGEVDLGGVVVPSWLDTGSMVTTITESYFKKTFSHLSILAMTNLKIVDGWDLRQLMA